VYGATLTRAPSTARSITTALVAAVVIFEKARSLVHFVGNSAAQQFSAHNYAAGDHRQEHGILDRRDAMLVPAAPNVTLTLRRKERR
jgi:hypothetical protein